MRSLRTLLAFAAVLLVAPALPAAAGAHVEMTTPKAPAGKPVKLGLEIGHGCEGAATTRLVVEVPARAHEARALPVRGWQARTADGRMIWSGGPLDDHDVQQFPFRATLLGEQGQTVTFKSIQQCEGGVSTAWIQSGVTDLESESERPAPTVQLTSTALEVPGSATPETGETGPEGSAGQNAGEDAGATGEPTATDEEAGDDDGGGRSLLLIIVVGLALGTVIGLIVRARRGK